MRRTLCALLAGGGAGSTSAATPNAVVHRHRTRDITLSIPSKDNLLRISFCSTATLLKETIKRHNLLVSTGAHVPFMQLVGTHLTFTNLLASSLDGEERIESRFTADEATILVDAAALGECRCSVRPQHNAQLIDEGLLPFPLKVDRILYNQAKPFSSVVNASLAEIAAAAAEECSQSDSAPATAGESEGPPYGLSLVRTDPDSLAHYFTYNTTLHGYNYFRKSDGVVPALWLDTEMTASVLAEYGLVSSAGDALPVPSEERAAADYAVQLDAALQGVVGHSLGAVVVPLAASSLVEQWVWRLQQALVSASAAPERSVAAAFRALYKRIHSEHVGCQYVLSFMTGDYEGAHAVATVARQYTQEPSAAAAVVDPLRQQLGIADFFIPLAAASEARRTSVDYFCRCSVADLLGSVVTAPEEVVQLVQESMGMRCTHCAQTHSISEAEWERFMQLRAKHLKS